MNIKKYFNKLIVLMLLVILVPTFNSIYKVSAGTTGGGGQIPTKAGPGFYHHVGGLPWTGSGTSQAWDKFYANQRTSLVNPYNGENVLHYKTDGGLERAINEAGKKSGGGFVKPNGQKETLTESCKRSQYIWWYGTADNDQWYDKGNKKWYLGGFWYTQAGATHTSAVKWRDMSSSAKIELNKYKAQGGNGWGGYPGIVIICSGTMSTPITPIITLKANSGSFQYNGKQQVVNGFTHVGGRIDPAHEIVAIAKASQSKVGDYPVEFSKAVIVEKNNRNKNVSNQYDIVKINGKLRIWDHLIPEEDLPESDYYRCINNINDSASAYTKNSTSGSNGFSPAGYLYGLEEELETGAGTHAMDGRTLPRPGQSKSAWDSWKATFLAGNSTETPELDLENNVSPILSKYGGVYNITRTLQKDTYNVTHCQPQTRRLETKYRTITEYYYVTEIDKDGKETQVRKSSSYQEAYQVWTPWEDSGARKIKASNGPNRVLEQNSYQILAVNCNKEGFERILAQVGGTDLSLANHDGSGLLQTPTYSGANNGNLGRYGETATNSFYEDGTSCREAYKCTVAPLPTAEHDGANNLGKNQLFTEETTDESGLVGKDSKSLSFFRDNENRRVRADVWYPKSTGKNDLFSYPDDNMLNSYAKIYRGTPEEEITTITPWTDYPDEGYDEQNKISTEETDLKGSINSFNVKSQWASKKDQPYELAVNWKYEGTWENRVPGVLDGYKIKDTVKDEGAFNVYCEFLNDPNVNQQANIPDTPHKNSVTRPKWNGVDSIKVLFTRSVTDTDK